jgi:tetratricopeptide (TPR) repeat protein
MIRRIFCTFFLLPVLLLALPSAAANSAKDLLSAGRVDEAISALNGRVSSSPSDAESFNLLCRAYYALEDWDRAESACKKAVSLDPNTSRYHRWLGRVYGEKANRANFLSAAGLAGKVRDEFQRAVDLDQADTNARIDLAEYFLEAPGIVGGGQDKARTQAKTIGTLDPAMEHWVYARIAEKNRDAATAEREYHQVISLSKGDAEAWLNMALFLRRQKRYDDMEQAIVKASQAAMLKPEVLVDAAQTLFHAGRAFPFAIELLQRYLASGPVEEAPAFKAHYLLGTILEKQGDKTGAAREYRASLSLARNFGLAQQALNRIGP